MNTAKSLQQTFVTRMAKNFTVEYIIQSRVYFLKGIQTITTTAMAIRTITMYIPVT